MRSGIKAAGTGILLAQMVFSLATFNVAFGADYYVDAANGNNAWTGISPTPGAPNGPKKNLYNGAGGDYSALEIPGLTGSDTIHVAAGTYDAANGEVFPYDYDTVGNGGTGPLPDGLRVRGADPATAVITGAGGATGIFWVNSGPYTNNTRIESLTITNTNGPGVRMRVGNGGEISPTIAGCTVTGCSQEGIFGDWTGAFTATATMAPVISACTVTSNGATGIQFTDNASQMINLSLTVRNSTVSDNSFGDGIDVEVNGTNARAALTVNPSTISGNAADGIDFLLENGASGTVNLSGNTITENEDDGVTLEATSGASLTATIKGNTISDNDNDGIEGSFTLTASGTITITGNTISDNGDVVTAVPRSIMAAHGIFIQNTLNGTCNATIGGPGAGQANTISGNTGDGIHLTASAGAGMTASVRANTVEDNGWAGVDLNASLGGTINANTVSNNTIAGNAYDGLSLSATNSGVLSGTFSSNGIGENGREGISLFAMAGGTINPAIDGNTVVFNGGDGVQMMALGAGVIVPTLQSNTIQANGWHGVSLSDVSGSGTCNPDLGGGGGSTGANWITDNYGTDDGGTTQRYEVNCLSSNPPTATIFAQNNYWGVIHTADIDTMIYDSNDQAGLSTVDYSGGAGFQNSVTSVVPVSGWKKAYVVAAGTDASANVWNGLIFESDGELTGSWAGFPVAADGVLSTWDIWAGFPGVDGNIYNIAKPLGNWNRVQRDADLFAGMWRSNGTYGPEGWAFYAPTSFRAKGTEFVIPMSGWNLSKVYVAAAKTPGVTNGTLEIYDANGTQQYTGNFTLDHFGAIWKSADLYTLGGAKPCVARITTDRDVTVGTGQYKLGSSGGWGSEVYPLAAARGTSFVFPANGWSKCWFEVANVSGAAVTAGSVAVYDAGGNLQGTIPFTIPNAYGYWRSDPDAIYALAKPAVVRVNTGCGEDVVVRHARYTTAGDMAGWGYSVLPTAAQQGANFEFPVKGWGNAYVELVNPGTPTTATVTIYDATGIVVGAPILVPLIATNGYARSWDFITGNLYNQAKPAKLTITPAAGNLIVTANCWTSTAAGKAGWAWGVLPR